MIVSVCVWQNRDRSQSPLSTAVFTRLSAPSRNISPFGGLQQTSFIDSVAVIRRGLRGRDSAGRVDRNNSSQGQPRPAAVCGLLVGGPDPRSPEPRKQEYQGRLGWSPLAGRRKRLTILSGGAGSGGGARAPEERCNHHTGIAGRAHPQEGLGRGAGAGRKWKEEQLRSA